MNINELGNIDKKQMKKTIGATLPLLAMRNIPTPNADAKTITALVKNSGKVTGYQLSDGSVIGKDQGVMLAKQGGIAGVGVAARNGTEYLKSIPDGLQSGNLSSLPTVE